MAKFRPRFWAGEHWWLLVGGRAANDPAPKNAILFRTVSAGTGGAGALEKAPLQLVSLLRLERAGFLTN